MTVKIDLGDNHAFSFVAYKGEHSGLTLYHLKPDGTQCSDSHISFTGRSWAREFNGEITTWEVVSEEPLTLSPSILCTVCGDHGFITKGKWVRA